MIRCIAHNVLRDAHKHCSTDESSKAKRIHDLTPFSHRGSLLIKRLQGLPHG